MLLLDAAEAVEVISSDRKIMVRVVPDPDRKLVTVYVFGAMLSLDMPAAETLAYVELDWTSDDPESMPVTEDDATVTREAFLGPSIFELKLVTVKLEETSLVYDGGRPR